MKKKISYSRLNTLMKNAGNLRLQERKATTYEGVELSEEEAVLTEFRIVKFHISRIAMEGEDIDTINHYKTVMKYAEMQFEKGKLRSCKKTLTMLKLFSGLDITFFTTLPEIREYVQKHEPLTLEQAAMIILSRTHREELNSMPIHREPQNEGGMENGRKPKKPLKP